MTAVLLLDYGGVLHETHDVVSLRVLAGRLRVEPAAFERRFFAGRREFDRGLRPDAYWTSVAGRALSTGELADATAVDIAFWSGVETDAVAAVERAAVAGLRLALLSNMPHPEADAYERLPWTEPFERLFFSCRFGLVKPDPALYEQVLTELGVEPQDVTFVDDRVENVDAAAGLGLDARLCRGAAELAALVEDLTRS